MPADTVVSAQAPSDAQNQPPIQEPAGVPPGGDDTEESDGDTKPWGRLIIFLPLSALIGIGAAFARRALADRGLVSD